MNQIQSLKFYINKTSNLKHLIILIDDNICWSHKGYKSHKGFQRDDWHRYHQATFFWYGVDPNVGPYL